MKKVLCYLLLLTGIYGKVSADFLVVPVEGVIDGGIAAFVERAVEEGESKGYEGIIFHINTPGGRVDSAVEIKDAIIGAEIPTIAYVDRSAISAGALITLACDSIYMAPGSSIGAATAVDLEGQKASEKIISYFRAQMRSTAEAKGRRADIAEAMVDEQIEIKGITAKGQLVTLTYTEAERLEISDGTIERMEDVTAAVGREKAVLTEFRLNWAERVVRFLTHPVVSSLLLSLGFLGLFFELQNPGWGVGGTVALIALGLFFGSHYILRLAGIGELILFLTGLILLGIEIFVIPGFGITGVLGIGFILASLLLSMVGNMPGMSEISRAISIVGGAFVVTFIGTLLIIKYFPRSPLYKRLSLETVQDSSLGYTSADTIKELVGEKGPAISDLRPAGVAMLKNKRVDVVTEGEYIEKGRMIEVIEVHGARVVVKRADARKVIC